MYASWVKTLHMQLYHSSVDIVLLVSEDPKTLSIFVKLLKSNTQYNPEESRKSNITEICKELNRNKQDKTKQQWHRCKTKTKHSSWYFLNHGKKKIKINNLWIYTARPTKCCFLIKITHLSTRSFENWAQPILNFT